MKDKLKTVDIKGKDYVLVNERVRAFRENYDGYGIATDMLSNDAGTVIFKAIITDPAGRTVSTGYAYEKENSSYINKTSYIENCETSAVGRALGFFGIGCDTSIASYEEVANAIAQQGGETEEDKKAVDEARRTFGDLTGAEVVCPICYRTVEPVTLLDGTIASPKQWLAKYHMCAECYREKKASSEKA